MLNPVPHILAWLAFACKILPDGPPEYSKVLYLCKKHLGKKNYVGTQGPHARCSTTHRRSEDQVCVGTHVYEKEGAVTKGGGRLGSGLAAGRQGLAPAGRPPLAPGQREPRTAPWMAGEGALRPLAAGPVPVRSRPPPPPPPRAWLAPFADSGGSVPPNGSFSGLPLPARHLPPVPAPCSCSDTPFCTPSRPQPQPGRTLAPSPPRASQSLPAAPAAPSRRPAGVRGQRAARVGRRRGLFHYAAPPRPRAARVLPGTPWSRRVPSGHKGARGTMGAASPWAPGARYGGSALRGGGRSSRRARSGQPPCASPPLLPPPPQHGCCSHSPVRLLRSRRRRRHRAAGLNRPALTWDTSSVLCRAGPRRVGAPRGGWGERGAGEWGPRAEGQAGAARGVAGGSGRAPCIFPSLCVCPCAALSRDVTGLRVSFPHKDTGAPAAVEPQPLRPHPRPAPPPQRGTRGTSGGARA